MAQIRRQRSEHGAPAPRRAATDRRHESLFSCLLTDRPTDLADHFSRRRLAVEAQGGVGRCPRMRKPHAKSGRSDSPPDLSDSTSEDSDDDPNECTSRNPMRSTTNSRKLPRHGFAHVLEDTLAHAPRHNLENEPCLSSARRSDQYLDGTVHECSAVPILLSRKYPDGTVRECECVPARSALMGNHDGWVRQACCSKRVAKRGGTLDDPSF